MIHFEWESAKVQFIQAEVLGGLIDVNANGVAFIVDIHNNAFFDFSGISTRAIRQFNVETVCFWKIFNFQNILVFKHQ